MKVNRHPGVPPQRRPRLRASSTVTSQQIGDEAVLIDLRTNEIYEMNRTASRMWKLIGDGRSLDEIEQQLEAEFEIDAKDLRDEIDSFLSTLLSAKLVEQI